MQPEINPNPEMGNNPGHIEETGIINSSNVIETPPPRPQRWGAWATIGFGLAILTIYMLAQNIVAGIFAAVNVIEAYAANPQLNILPYALKYLQSLTTDGLLVSVATFVSVILGLGFIYLFIKLRCGLNLREYLELKPIGKKTILVLLAVIVGVLGLFTVVGRFLPEQNSDFVTGAYNSAGWLPLLWVALVIFAPVFEESFFRGFLFVGLKQSVLGPVGTIILTAAIFAILHSLQYDPYTIAVIFVLGIIFGVVRLKTGSLWSTILLHAFWNLLQLATVAVYLK